LSWHIQQLPVVDLRLNNYFLVNDPAQPFERMLEATLDLILSGIGVHPAAREASGS
jgi:hypothetical protein